MQFPFFISITYNGHFAHGVKVHDYLIHRLKKD